MTCPHCGGSMAGADVQAKFCSDNCRKRHWEQDEAQRGYCECGALLGHDSLRRGYTRCRACYHDERLAATAERGKQIERWWKQGLSLNEIASRFGWSRQHLHGEMDRLRAKGFDLRYRYRGVRNGTKFPGMRKAA